jgi:protein required for attachment to host cells
MGSKWVVLANAARARVFDREGENRRLVEILDLVHPQSREKAADLSTDREGHAQKAHGDRGHAGTAFEPRTDFHRKEMAIFAAEIARHLELSVVQGHCTDVAILASDPFLGECKKHLGAGTQRVLSAALPRDLTALLEPELTERVTRILREARFA